MLSNTRRRLIAACASVMLVLGLGAVTTSPSDAADQQVSLYGVVKADYPWGEGIPDLAVRVYKATGNPASPWALDQTVYTQEEHSTNPLCPTCKGYWYAKVGPGTYRATVNELDDGTANWQQWSSETTTSAVVDGTQEQVESATPPVRHAGGELNIPVVDQCKEPIQGATFESYLANSAGDVATTTAANSSYLWLPRTPARVKITGPAAAPGTVWLTNASSFATAKTFALGPGVYSEQPNVVLTRTTFNQPSGTQQNPKFRGTVVSPTGTQIAGVPVRLYRKTYDPDSPWKLEATIISGSTSPGLPGYYEALVPPGEYRMTANEADGTVPVVSTWRSYSIQGTEFDPSVPICATMTTGGASYDARLDYSGRTISGTVKDTGGHLVKGATVEVYSATADDGADPQLQTTTTTNSIGGYTVHGTTDQIKLRVTESHHTPIWSGGGTSFDTASPIDATPGADSTTNDAALGEFPLTLDRIPYITIHGGAKVGTTIGTDGGEWRPYSPITISHYQWYRVKGSTSTKLTGYTSSHYKIRKNDLGSTLKVQVTAHYPGAQDGVAFSEETQKIGNTSSIKLSGHSYSKHTAKIKITVKTSGTSKPDGKVTLKYGVLYNGLAWFNRHAKHKTVKFKDGKATVTLKGLGVRENYIEGSVVATSKWLSSSGHTYVNVK
ncbi:MAG: hypothetical protein QOJ72_1394 [Nocardioidaceae bacterium]|nr:hypothetical protein [Nocardioidaceae bacterium]